VAPFPEGIKPAVLALILGALIKLAPKAWRTTRTTVLGVAAAIGMWLGLSEVLLLLGLGLAGLLVARASPPPGRAPTASPGGGAVALAALGTGTAAAAAAVAPPTLLMLGWIFLKIGCVLYGGGYVLFAFLEGDLVGRLEWLTRGQLLDAIAAGQLTPGPMLSSATFVGYQVLGTPGALVATAGVFLPSFVFVLLSNPLVPRLRRWRWTGTLLDGVNAASVGLMVGMLLKLSVAALWPTGAWHSPAWSAAAILALAIGVTLRWRVNPTWVVLGGALAGAALTLIGAP
jgi:chromate transporter